MFNLDKLNVQLKDLDVAQLIKLVREHQNSVIKAALIIGTLLMVAVMFNDHRVRGQNLRTQISQAEEKLDALKNRDASVGQLNDYKSSLPKKINEFELIRLISNYAKLHHVTITSLSPAESKDMGLYDSINVSFNGASDSFKNMMLFLRNIEKSEFPLRIDSWSGNKESNGDVSFIIAISAVLIHT